MTVTVKAVPLLWTPIDLVVTARIHKELNSWLGTPYRHGMCKKGPNGGANCITFVGGFLDAAYRWAPIKITTWPGDVSLHNPSLATRILREMLGRYPHDEIREEKSLEIGDMLVTGPLDGGPGHVCIAGMKQGLIYQALEGSGVVRTGCGYDPNVQQKFRIYRPKFKNTWFQN